MVFKEDKALDIIYVRTLLSHDTSLFVLLDSKPNQYNIYMWFSLLNLPRTAITRSGVPPSPAPFLPQERFNGIFEQIYMDVAY